MNYGQGEVYLDATKSTNIYESSDDPSILTTWRNSDSLDSRSDGTNQTRDG